MSVVFKYAFDVPSDRLEIELPVGSRFLAFAFQRDVPTIWCLVSERREKVPRRFRVFGTGHPVPDSVPLEYLGSALGYGDGLVLHLFEEVTS